MNIYELLFNHYGPQQWWPGQSKFEIIAGAILTQNTNWANVEKAIANLKKADCLSAQKLHDMEIATLAELIRPAGYYNIKAKRLKNFLDWLFADYNGDLNAVESLSVYELRPQLLKIKGIGPETADSILLYAFEKCVFVVDTYTCRIMVRHNLLEEAPYYELVQEFFESFLPADVKLFNEYHALLVRVAKEFCKTKPKCCGCPLKSLPHQTQEKYLTE